MDKRISNHITINQIIYTMRHSNLFIFDNLEKGKIEIPNSEYFFRIRFLYFNYGGWVGWRKIKSISVQPSFYIEPSANIDYHSIFSFPHEVEFEEVFNWSKGQIKDFFIFNLDLFT